MTHTDQLGREALIKTLLDAGVSTDADDDRVFAGQVADRVLAAHTLPTGPVITRATMEAWVAANYPEIEPSEKRAYYRTGDDPYVDERNRQLSALEDLIDAFFPYESQVR